MNIIFANLITISLFIFSTGCFSSSGRTQTSSVKTDKNAAIQENAKITSSAKDDEIEYPQIENLSIGLSSSSVSLFSDTKDKEDYFLPPYTSAEIQNIWFDIEPKIGAMATIIPLGTNINPIDLEITDKKRIDRSGYVMWETKLKKTTDKSFLDAAPQKDRRKQYPFDVCVLYPAVKNAKSIPRKELKEESLPRGVKLNSIYAAIDVTQDDQPDYVMVRYCKSGNDALFDCEFDISSIFVKDGKTWKVWTEAGD